MNAPWLRGAPPQIQIMETRRCIMEYKNSFVCYESVYRQFERLTRRGKQQEANAFINAVMRYGLYGEKPDEESEIWDFGFDGIIATISSAKERYKQKFNIPKEELSALLVSGRTQQQIADHYGCSVDTIQRRLKDYGLNSSTAKNTAKQAAPHGTAENTAKGRTQLNVNDNENRKAKENGSGNTATPPLLDF